MYYSQISLKSYNYINSNVIKMKYFNKTIGIKMLLKIILLVIY